MSGRILTARPLTRAAFEPFGDVIDTGDARHFSINRGAVERYHDLATVEVGEDGRALVSIFEARRGRVDPLRVDLVERHPLGSQAFIPMDGAVMCVVVAPAGEKVRAEDLQAFVSDGRQGVNYHRGIWHMPLAAFRTGQRFVVVDRGGPGGNCEERLIEPPVEVRIGAGAARGAGA